MGLLESIRTADLLVVGSGFFGSTIAQQAASAGYKVVVIERRDHIAGNAFSFREKASGVEVHKYGTHIFHTSNRRIWDYVNLFTSFNDYKHHVYTKHKGRIYPMPISLATLCQFYDRDISPEEGRELLGGLQNGGAKASNLEEKAISSIGHELYGAFVKGYTTKQWGMEPDKLPPETIARLPVRLDFNTRYFSDTWEGIPVDGYTKWVENMLLSGSIQVFTGVDFFDLPKEIRKETFTVYTGPIDKYFNFKFGMLGWRTLDFQNEVLDIFDFQGTSVMNYADLDVEYTRVHEFKHLESHKKSDLENVAKTYVSREYSRFATREDEPYYPINSVKDRAMLEQYKEIAAKETGTYFGGRLGSYKYLDMHMAIGAALTAWDSSVLPGINSMNRTI